MNRLFLYSGLLFILILIFDAYDRDYNQAESINIEQNKKNASSNSKQPPQAKITTKALPMDVASVPRKIATIENSKLLVKYDGNSGELLYAELKDYSVGLGSKDNIIILDFDNKKYSASSDVQVMNSSKMPTFEIANTTKNKVTLVASNINDIVLSKTIKLLDNTHQLSITNMITNNSNKDIRVRNYETISRDNNSQASIMLPTFTGGAYYDETNKFSKLSFEDIAENTETVQAKNSWISMIEHYFFSAWLPTSDLEKTIYTDYQNNIYTIGSSTNYITLNPGNSISYDSLMFVGPKLQSEISNLTEGLDLTVDYGVLTFLSAPLFWILEFINKIFGNWGFSIIALTLLIKAVFFKLSETSYRSMAEMKKLTPRMQALKER